MEDDTDDLYDKKEEAQNIFTNNIFSDDRIQIPESRIYTIEYKTSPIVYYKNPTRNTDYFTKTRRIKDYQRIMNYVNKMINERITAASTVAMLKHSYAFDKNLPITTMTGIKRSETKHSLKKVKNIDTNSDKKTKCICSHKMNQLLSNMITLLQKLLPNSTHDILRTSKMCDERNKSSIKPDTNRNEHDSVNKYIKDASNRRNVLKSQPHLNKNNPVISQTLLTKVEEPNILMQSLFPKVNHSLKSLIQLMLSNNFPDKSKMAINFNKHKSAMKKPSMADTENYYVLSEEVSDSLPIIKNLPNITSSPIKINNINQKLSADLLIATDFATQKNEKKFPAYIKVEDHSLTSPAANMIENFPDLDIHTMELVKSKLIPGKKNTHYAYDKSDKKKELNKTYDSTKDENNNRTKALWTLSKMGEIKNTDTNVEHFDENNHSSMRKMGNIVRLEPNLETKSEDDARNYYRSLRKFGQIIMPEYRNEMKTKNNHDKRRDTLFQKTKSPLSPVSTSIYSSTNKFSKTRLKHSTGKPNFLNFTQGSSDYETLEDEDDKNFDQDEQTSINFKKIDKDLNLFNDSVAENDYLINNTQSLYFDMNNENFNSTEEVNPEINFPRSKTSYLEINRNNWKHTENED